MDTLVVKIEFQGLKVQIRFVGVAGKFKRREWMEEKFAHPHAKDLRDRFKELVELSHQEGLHGEEAVADLAVMTIELLTKIKGPIDAIYKTMVRIVVEHEEHSHVIAEGTSFQSPEDEFDAETGRQWALERALVKLPPQLAGHLLDAYINRPGWVHTWDVERSAKAKTLLLEAIDAKFGPFWGYLFRRAIDAGDIESEPRRMRFNKPEHQQGRAHREHDNERLIHQLAQDAYLQGRGLEEENEKEKSQ